MGIQRHQPVRRSFVGGGGGNMDYVPCPNCGDPVAGKLEGELICIHCNQKFQFDKSQVRNGIVVYDDVTRRWKALSFSS